MSSFYIGYLPKAPRGLQRFLRRSIAALVISATVLAAVIVLAQKKFSPAVFEFTTIRDFTGRLKADPYPSLTTSDQSAETTRTFLLVGVGKRGFAERVREFDGKDVHLRAKLIYRNEGAMLEVMPNTIASASTSRAPAADRQTSQFRPEIVTFTGEIVDTKCFLGVMNPGRSKVHRDCATRCISGGVPPALLVGSGHSSTLYLLTDSDGGKLGIESIIHYVGEPVRVTGTTLQSANPRELRVSKVETFY